MSNLVLSVREGQTVTVMPDIEVFISRVSGRRVSIAFRAPNYRKILRDGAVTKENPLRHRGYVVYAEGNQFRWHNEGMQEDPDDPRWGLSPTIVEAVAEIDKLEDELTRELAKASRLVTTEEAKREGAPF